MPKPLVLSNSFGWVWFDWVLWHINHCWLFNAKSSLNIYIRYIWFSLVGFYGISTIVGYLMPNPIYTYILNKYMVWFGWVLCHINHCWLFNAKSYLCIYIEYIWFVNSLCIYILNDPELILLYTGFKYCYVSQTIQLNTSHMLTQLNDQTVPFLTIQFSISHLFAHSLNIE